MEFSIEKLKPLAEELAQMIENELEKEDRPTARGIEAGIRQRLREMEIIREFSPIEAWRLKFAPLLGWMHKLGLAT